MGANSNRIIELFNQTAKKPPEERKRFLEEACAGEPDLRVQIKSLLCAHDQASDFLKPEPLSAATTFLTEKPGDRIGRYKLLQKIGEGGCGLVYMAEQEEPVLRRVALKVIKLGMDTRSVIARFEAERQALALMDHPNIAKVHDAGATETGRPYFVMELIRGIKITDYCDEKNLSTRERLGLFSLVCHAIQHAHQKGIIHRDIKPSNVLVTVNDGVAVPKVIDFGIAKATTDQPLADKSVFTAFEQFIGTPAYMSPEQAEITSVDVDTRSDIYSLGVLLYELLSGTTPFDAKELLQAGLDEMRRTLREREPERPSTRVSTLGWEELTTAAKRRGLEPPKLANVLHGDLDWIVMKCLEKDRARRYETANGLASDIQRHLSNEPVIACPPSTFYRFQKLVRRNLLAFTAAGAVAAALLLGLGVSTWMFVQERKAEWEQARLREEADSARRRADADKQQAQTEAAKSQQVAAFLKKMLQGVGPSVSRGRDTTMLREILDETDKSISKDLSHQPEVQVELFLTLADTYHDLGLYQQMEDVARKSLQVARSGPGEENENVAASLIRLGGALMHLGQLRLGALFFGNLAESEKFRRMHDGNLVEAERCCREGLATSRRILGEENPAVAMALTYLGKVLETQGRMAEAETTHREALAIYRKLLGNEHPKVARALCDLAEFIAYQNKSLAEAEDIVREALSIQGKALGNDHPEFAESLSNLAVIMSLQGRWVEAEAKYREALAIWKKLQVNNRLEVASALNNLGFVLMQQSKQAEAETVFREAVAIRRKVLGNEHPDVADSLEKLANALQQQCKLAEAEKVCRESLAIERKLFGNDHTYIAWSLECLANVLEEQGKAGEAETLLCEWLVIHRNVFGNAHSTTIQLVKELRALLEREGKQAEAKALVGDLSATTPEKKPEPH